MKIWCHLQVILPEWSGSITLKETDMKTGELEMVQIVRGLPGTSGHPEEMVRALVGIGFPFNLAVVNETLFGRHSKWQRPPSTFLPVPMNAIVEGLAEKGRTNAVRYWRDNARPPFLAIPVACCWR